MELFGLIATLDQVPVDTRAITHCLPASVITELGLDLLRERALQIAPGHQLAIANCQELLADLEQQ